MTKRPPIFFFLLVGVLLFLCVVGSSFSEDKKPLGFSEIEMLLKNSVANRRIISLVNQHGISFLATDKDMKRLRSLGANNETIIAIRRASSKTRRTERRIRVISVPPGGEVFLNRHYKGVTPLVINAATGYMELRVGGMEGFDDYIDNVSVADGETKTIEVTLRKKTSDTKAEMLKPEDEEFSSATIRMDPTNANKIGTVFIETVPAGAFIYISGRYKAKSPAEISLFCGIYTVVVIKDNYKVENISLNAREGINPPIMVRLIPK